MQPFILNAAEGVSTEDSSARHGAVTPSSANLLLDQPRAADIDAITRYCQDPVVEKFLTIPWPYTREDAEFFVNTIVPKGWESGTELFWALRAEGEFVGVISLRASDGMIGFWLGAPHRGRGYMPRAVTAVADWAFSSGFTGDAPLRWEAVVGNIASLAVARKAGFRFLGIGPRTTTGRDGSRPDAWQAELHPDDNRSIKSGWPAPRAATALVLFDLDDTLLAHREAVDRGITVHRATLDEAVFSADDATEIRRWHSLEEHHYHRYLSGEIDFRGQRVARARDFVATYGVTLDDAAADRWYSDYYLEYAKAWKLHDDSLPCLKSLQKSIPGVRMGIITNGELDFQARKVTTVGLEPYTEHLITSGELGITKPDARIFQHACSLFDIDPSAAVYVGDRLHTDAIGAARAGLTGVWLDRLGAATPEELAAAAASGVIVIRSLTELPPLLAALPD